MKYSVHFITVCLFLFHSQQGIAQSIINTRTQTPYATIQTAVNGAGSGDTLTVAAGTYTLSGRLTVNKSISLIGQDEATTIIDASANGTDYGILISASNVTLTNFTIKPPLGPGVLGTSNGGGYAIHVSNTPSILSNVTITHITVKNGNRSGIDINGVDHAVISYVTTQNAAYGNGMNITGVHGANISQVTTGGNAWGGIAVYVSIPSQANRGSDNIIIDATTCSIPEGNKVYAQNESGLLNTNVTVAGYDYITKNSSVALSGYTWYQDNVANAVAYSTIINASSPGSTISQLSSGTFYVGSGMSIQSAINSASEGGTVQVLAGTYNSGSTISISKGISLLGPNFNISPNTGVRLPEGILAGQGSPTIRVSTISPVTIKGFKFTTSPSSPVFPPVDSYTAGNNIVVEKNIVDSTAGFYFNSPSLFSFSDNLLTNLRSDEGLLIAGNYNGLTGTSVTIDGNTWTNISVSSCMNLSSVSGSVTSNNFINVAYYALLLANSSGNFTFSNNSIDGVSTPDPQIASGWGAGVRFYTLTNAGPITVTNNTFSNCFSGIVTRINESIAGFTLNIHDNIFSNNTAHIRHLSSGNLDVSHNTYDGKLPSAMTQSELFSLEDKIVHRIDDSNFGFAVVKSHEVFVTTNSYTPSWSALPYTGTLTPSIQRGITAAGIGDTVNVAAGTYNESLTIAKSMILQGDPTGSRPLIELPDGTAGTVTITANNVTIQGLQINKNDQTSDAGLISVPRGGTFPNYTIAYSDITLNNLVFTKGRRAAYITGQNVTIENSTFSGQLRDALYFDAVSGTTTIATNQFSGATGSKKAILIEGFTGIPISSGTVTISGNTLNGKDNFFVYNSWGDPAGKKITLNLTNNKIISSSNNGIAIYDPRQDGPFDPSNFAKITSMTVTGNDVSGVASGKFGVVGITDANYPVAVNASDNWWGTAVISTIQSKLSGVVTVSPYYVNSTMSILSNVLSASVFVDAAFSDGNSAGHIFGYDAFSKIQDGIGAVATGGDVHVAAGIYDETININKWITLVGAGTGNTGTILKNSAAQGDFVKLPLVAGVTYGGYRPNVIISASGVNSNKPLLLKDLQIEPGPNDGYPRPAIMLQPGPAGGGYVASYSYVELDNIRAMGDVSGDTPGQADPHVLPVSSNTRGITIDGSTSLLHSAIKNCEFSDMTYGMIFYNNASNPSTVEDIEISNTTFARNSVKGFYAEKLSDATFTDVAVTNNGNINHSPYYWAWNNAGIDITLQYGVYRNLVFNNLTVNGNGIGSYAGAGLTVKARGTGNDDPALHATLNGVTVNGGTFSGNTVGIRFGEVNNPSAPMYWNPPAQSLLNSSPTNVTVNNAAIFSNRQLGISNLLSGIPIAAEGNWWGSASGPQNTETNPSGHGDTLNSNVDYAPWWDRDYNGVAHPWAWSTNGDLLSAINTVSHGDTLNFLGSNPGKLNISKNVIVNFASPPVIDSVNVTDGDLVLSSTITVSGNLNLSNGNIITKDSNKIVFDTSAVIPTETQHGAIIGTVEVVPRNVGTGSLNLLGLSIGSGNDNLEKVGVTRKSGDDAAVTISDNAGIATTWTIEADHQPSSGREVVFSWLPDFDNHVDTTRVVVYRNSGSGWRQFAGPFSVSGIPRQVTVNATGFSSWTLGSVSSTPLVPRLNINTRTITLPTVKLGQWKDTVIAISNNGTDTLKITSISSTKNYFSVRPTLFIVPPGETRNDTIRFVSDSIGVRNAVITFVNNAATSPDVISVTGVGSGTPILALHSRSITFPSMNIGQWVDTVLTISNTGNDTLKITSITSTRSNVSFRPTALTIAPHETKNDTMRFVSDLYGARNALINIISNAATNPDVITVDGFGIGTPILAVNPRSITFPAVRIGQWKDTVITMTNTGNDILDITNITSTRNYFSIRPTILSILPGETSNDTIRFMPDSIGLRTASFSIVTNASASYDMIFTTGFSIGTPGLTLNSRSLNFPAMNIGQWTDTVVTVTNTGSDTLKISNVTSSKNYFNIRLTDLIVPPGETRYDTIRFMPDSIGSRSALISFVSNAATSPDTIVVTGYGLGTSGLVLNPRSISFPAVNIGQWRDTVVTITNNGNDTLKITSITSTKNYFSVRPALLIVPPGEIRNDTLRFVPDSIGVRTSLIRFVSNAATSPDTIAVTGLGLGTPTLALNPRSITFPAVKISQWKDTVVAVTNTGNDTLKITGITSTRSYFSIRPTLLTVPPGGTRNDTLRFIPDSIGFRNDLFIFVSNAAAGPDTIAVTGFGIGTPTLVLNTRSITFPVVKIGQWRDTVVTIRNSGTDTLKITSITSTRSYFNIHPTVLIISPGGIKNDTIRFTSDSTGIRKAFIHFVSNADTSPDTVTVNGNGTTTGIAQIGPEIPESFELFQNYPNPFNPTTTIKFKLPGPGTRYVVSLRVYDILGRMVAVLLSDELPAGSYVQQWNAQNLSSGIYFYRLDAHNIHDEQTGSFMKTKELVLIK